MTHLTAMTAAHAADRLADWRTALRAENKSPGTVAVYAGGATRYLRWRSEHDRLPMSRADMLIRYTRATASERAAVEAHLLDLGNL